MSAPSQFVGYLSHLVKNYLAETWFLFLLIAWFFVKSLPARVRALRSTSWPIAQGHIETVGVNTINTQKQIATANLGYSYYAEGELYSGYYSRQFHDEQAAWDYASGLKDKTVVVRYKPGHPEVSALRINDQTADCKLNPESDHFFVHFYRLLTRTGW
jgi:hypothetical protein